MRRVQAAKKIELLIRKARVQLSRARKLTISRNADFRSHLGGGVAGKHAGSERVRRQRRHFDAQIDAIEQQRETLARY